MSTNRLKNAAMVLKSLPKSQAAIVLSRLEAKDIKAVFGALEEISCATSEEVLESICQLNEEVNAIRGDAGPIGGLSLTTDPQTSQAMAEEVSIPESLKFGSDHLSFAFMADIEPELRASVLKDEHPRNIAAVLCEVSPEVASCVMSRIDSAQRLSVLKRLCHEVVIDQKQKAELCYSLKSRIRKQVAEVQRDKASIRSVAQLMVASDDKTQDSMLKTLNQSSPDLSRQLEEVILDFDRLQDIDDHEIRQLLKSVDTSLWAPALKFALFATRRKVMSNMAPKVALILQNEIAELGAIDELTARQAQRSILATRVELSNAGRTKLMPTIRPDVMLPTSDVTTS